jgi:lipoprotein-anchoring transpeptidase ErfK/SrfK
LLASLADNGTPSPIPTESIDDIDVDDFGPPDFPDGALGLWTKKKHFTVYKHPVKSSKKTRLKAWNPLGQRLRLLVLNANETRKDKGWFQVMLPERPNGAKGWVRSDRKTLRVDQLPDRIEVDLSDRKLKYFREGKLKERFSVGVGQDQYPTPKGLFYVWASVPQPSPAGPYGRFALGLSGFSPVLSDWPGGGRAAIHGTVDPTDRGQKVSHGCVRVFNKDMRKLEKVPLGTPVTITK